MSAAPSESHDLGGRSAVHIDEAHIEIRFESMCRARGFSYATERLEAVRQRVYASLTAEFGADPSGWIG